MANGSNTSRRGGGLSRNIANVNSQTFANAVATAANAQIQQSGWATQITFTGGQILLTARRMVRTGRAANINAAIAQIAQNQGLNPSQLAQQILQQQQNAQPTAATQSQDSFMKMDGATLVSYLNNLSTTVKLPPLQELPEADTQRLVYDLALNAKPTVVSEAEFNKISGDTYYRGVAENVDSDGAVISTAREVANQTMYGDATRIGAGVHGDGFYFSGDKSVANAYAGGGKTINQAAIMKMKIDPSKARIVEARTLEKAFSSEPAEVRRAFEKMSGVDNKWSGSYLAAYALWKGYNTIKVTGRGFMIPISREAMILSDTVVQQV